MAARVISFKVPGRLLERVDAYAERRGLARSEVIRDAILALLAREGFLAPWDELEEVGDGG